MEVTFYNISYIFSIFNGIKKSKSQKFRNSETKKVRGVISISDIVLILPLHKRSP